MKHVQFQISWNSASQLLSSKRLYCDFIICRYIMLHNANANKYNTQRNLQNDRIHLNAEQREKYQIHNSRGILESASIKYSISVLFLTKTKNATAAVM